VVGAALDRLKKRKRTPTTTESVIYHCEKQVMMVACHVFSPPQYLMRCGLQCGFTGNHKTVAAHERDYQPQRAWKARSNKRKSSI
jgi:hypothetical protein